MRIKDDVSIHTARVVQRMVITTRFEVPAMGDDPPGDGISRVAASSDARSEAGSSDMLVTARCPKCRGPLVPRMVVRSPAWCCPCSHPELFPAARWVITGIDLPAEEDHASSPGRYLAPEAVSPRLRRLLGVRCG